MGAVDNLMGIQGTEFTQKGIARPLPMSFRFLRSLSYLECQLRFHNSTLNLSYIEHYQKPRRLATIPFFLVPPPYPSRVYSKNRKADRENSGTVTPFLSWGTK